MVRDWLNKCVKSVWVTTTKKHIEHIVSKHTQGKKIKQGKKIIFSQISMSQKIYPI